MKLFGQFLVDQGLITKDDFLKAMITQANELPSLPSAIHDLKLLTLDQQMQAFDYQSTHLKDYRVACIELGLWDEAYFEHALIRFYLSRLQPLGEILVREGCLTASQLADALAKYVEIIDYQNTEASPLISKVESPAPQPRIERGTSDTFSPAEKTLCYLYCRHFSDARFAKLLELAENPSEDLKASAKRDLTAIRTAASLIRADRSKELIEKIQRASETPERVLPNDMAIDQAIRVLWELRECFSAGMTEAAALQSNPSLNDRLQESLSALLRIG